MNFKKAELLQVLLTLSGITTEIVNGVSVNKQVGLLHEDIQLSLKRRLQKIMEEIFAFYEAYQKDRKEVEGKFKDDGEKLVKELGILDEELVTLNSEQANLAMIEEIKTSNNYDFKLIDRFAK